MNLLHKTFLLFSATALLLGSCSKENTDAPEGGHMPQGEFVSVALPVQVADLTTDTPPSVMSKSAAAGNPAEGFSVSFGESTTEATAATRMDATDADAALDTPVTRTDSAPDSPATRTDSAPDSPATRTVAQALSNVWVLQFNASGTNISTTRTATLAAGAHLTPTLVTGTGQTIYIIANGPASGLSTSNPATLADFESNMLHTAAVSNTAALPMAGKLTGVSVVNLGDGKGAVRQLGDASAAIVLRRIHAEVTLALNFAVTDYTLTSAQLYNVPVGATYGWNSATTTFPSAAAANFGYTSTSTAGLTPLTTATSGTKKTYKWFVGDNRRGEVAGLTAQSDRHSATAPAYATFARITLTNSTTATKKIYYDIYLGSGDMTNFDVKRNHTYTLTATIKGTAASQEALIDTDARLSSVGIPISIWFTDSKADSPFLISPKSKESTATMIWGPTTPSISGAQDVYNGKANTTAIMTTSATAYPAAKYCRDLGAQYYLPAQAELMLMWIYLDAIPAAECPASGAFWSSTEGSGLTSYAWRVSFSYGSTNDNGKGNSYSVRCVREN